MSLFIKALLFFFGGLLAGFPDDVDLIAGLHQFEAFADFQFLLSRIIDEAVDAFPSSFDFLVQQKILALQLLNGVLLLNERSNSPRSPQGD
jgi:hypothetical protein